MGAWLHSAVICHDRYTRAITIGLYGVISADCEVDAAYFDEHKKTVTGIEGNSIAGVILLYPALIGRICIAGLRYLY